MNIESFKMVEVTQESLKMGKAVTIAGLAKKIDFILDIVSNGEGCSRACPSKEVDEVWCEVYACKECWHDYLDKNTPPAHENKYVAQLEKEHAFMLALLVDIERAIDHGDHQQIAVAIKRLRDILGTETILKESIKPGLVRM
jgi:hypothetical protein